MNKNRFSPKLIAGIIVALFVGVALYLRIVLPYDEVFSGGWIKFIGSDAYHYMRLVDNLVYNFPRLIDFDPYMRYPQGLQLGTINFFVYFLSGVTYLFGLGSPNQHTIEVVSAYFPAVIGALTVIPVYFIGKELFNRWAGVLAAGLIAILPGEFLARSILGRTDRDAVELLLTTLTMLFLILAIKSARQKQLTFDHLKRWDWAAITKPLIYSLLAGVFLGIYLLTWKGALLFVLIIAVYLIIQCIIDHLRHKFNGYLCFIGTVIFFVALMISWPISSSQLYVACLIIGFLIPLVLAGVSWMMVKRRIRPAYYPLTLIGLGIVGMVILRVIDPSLFSAILGNFSRIFAQPATKLTIVENQPIFLPSGNLSFSIVWANFTTSFFLGLISLGILIYFTIKQGGVDRTLLIVWSLVILVATLAMRRFALLFTLNVALLSGYMSWLILEFAGFKETAVKPLETSKKVKNKAKQKRARKGGFRFTTGPIYMAFMVVVVFFLTFFPNIGLLVALASQPPFAPSDGWVESLSWLKDNTPDPFGDPDFYYDIYETPFHYPETAYGVVAWWDYGYQIIRTGHRLPNCDPGGGARGRVAHLFKAQDEASANEIIDKLDPKYVIIDYDTVTRMFSAVVTYAGSSQEEFFDIYYQKQEGNIMVPVRFFYPEYYRSLAVRLYNFDGGVVTPQSSTVISYEEKVRQDGMHYKAVMSVQSFPSYEEAEAYVLSQESDNYKIVGNNPFISPVPLEALEHYELIYSSGNRVTVPDVGRIPEVRIFEYNE